MSEALSHGFRSLSRQPPPDPDVQATLSDFLTYTEHLPAHLIRSFALIEDQRLRVEEKIKNVHDNAVLYSTLPTIKTDRPDPVHLRRAISYALEDAERAARMEVEEATRLEEMWQRAGRQLDIVGRKLKAQPLPPSRDPTPEQQALTSPNLKRERRTSLRIEEPSRDKPSRKLTDKAATFLRGRKIMVPGEVLPPPDPNAAVESISDWTSPRASPPLLEEPPALDKKATPRPRSRTPKVPKGERERSQKPRPPRLPGQVGTNAHSAVAGISTSNALLALTAPPDDAPKGSKWLPWMKLTEWEMAKLRKRMKKNAIWVPSQTMVRRELKTLGRGVAGKEAARGRAAEAGGSFVDESGEVDPTKVLISGEESDQINQLLGDEMPTYADDGGEDADQELINRGMRLNEAKKLKRQRMLEQAAIEAQIAREQGLEVVDVEKKVLDSKHRKEAKKRKRDSTPANTSTLAPSLLETPDPLSRPGPPPKRLKITAPSLPATKVPLAPAGASPRSSNRNRRAETPLDNGRKPTIILKAGKAVSEEPPNRRASLRRNSNASLPNGNLHSPGRAAVPTPKGGGRRSRRPAPGILTSAEEGSAKVGVSKRKAAPRKKGTASTSTKSTTPAAEVPELVPEEYVDPDEPRYCICGDVSWGTMIACDNDDCDKEWFHLSCVALDELPPRRTKWYCPDCRKKLKLGQSTNGLVGKVGGR